MGPRTKFHCWETVVSQVVFPRWFQTTYGEGLGFVFLIFSGLVLSLPPVLFSFFGSTTWHARRRQWHPALVLLPGKSHGRRSLVGAVHGVVKSRTRLSDFPFTFHFHALEKEMATHSSVLAWRIPGTGEPGGLPSMGSHRVGHD